MSGKTEKNNFPSHEVRKVALDIRLRSTAFALSLKRENCGKTFSLLRVKFPACERKTSEKHFPPSSCQIDWLPPLTTHTWRLNVSLSPLSIAAKFSWEERRTPSDVILSSRRSKRFSAFSAQNYFLIRTEKLFYAKTKKNLSRYNFHRVNIFSF